MHSWITNFNSFSTGCVPLEHTYYPYITAVIRYFVINDRQRISKGGQLLRFGSETSDIGDIGS